MDCYVSLKGVFTLVRMLNTMLPQAVLEQVYAEGIDKAAIQEGQVLVTITHAPERSVEGLGRHSFLSSSQTLVSGWEQALIGVLPVDEETGFRGFIVAEQRQRYAVVQWHDGCRLEGVPLNQSYLILGSAPPEVEAILSGL